MAFPTGWLYRAALTIDRTKGIDADLTDWTLVFDQTFGSLLTQTDGPLDADGACPSINGGGDIRFSSDAAGSTRLACDIRAWVTNNTPASATCEVAVKIPSVSSAANTTIYMWWGKSGETQPAVSDTYGQYNAYDSHYEAVWPDGGGTSQRKSASYTGTGYGSVSQGDATGKVGKGTTYVASSVQYWLLSGIPIETRRACTFEACARGVFETNKSRNLYDERCTTNANQISLDHFWYLSNETGHRAFRAAQRDNDSPANLLLPTYAPDNIADNTWYHVANTFNGTNSASMYSDGVLRDTKSDKTISTFSGINIAVIGTNGFTPTADWSFNGIADEIRISRTSRSAAWLKANYNNQFKTSGFLAFGSVTRMGQIKSRNSLAWSSVKSLNGLARASIKSVNGLTA